MNFFVHTQNTPELAQIQADLDPNPSITEAEFVTLLNNNYSPKQALIEAKVEKQVSMVRRAKEAVCGFCCGLNALLRDIPRVRTLLLGFLVLWYFMAIYFIMFGFPQFPRYPQTVHFPACGRSRAPKGTIKYSVFNGESDTAALKYFWDHMTIPWKLGMSTTTDPTHY